jgi:hypothetical protein
VVGGLPDRLHRALRDPGHLEARRCCHGRCALSLLFRRCACVSGTKALKLELVLSYKWS